MLLPTTTTSNPETTVQTPLWQLGSFLGHDTKLARFFFSLVLHCLLSQLKNSKVFVQSKMDLCEKKLGNISNTRAEVNF